MDRLVLLAGALLCHIVLLVVLLAFLHATQPALVEQFALKPIGDPAQDLADAMVGA